MAISVPMRKSRLTESQILAVLAEGESELLVAEVCRMHGIGRVTN
jgi:putative transposase